MVKYVDQGFQKPKITPSNVVFGPQAEHIEFAVMEEERNHKIFTL